MSADPQAAPGHVDAQGALAIDVQCKNCAYNLRGLREDGRCPECGTPIGLSTRGDLLCYASPDWLDKVALGLKVILYMVVVGIIVGGLAAVLSKLLSPMLARSLSFLASLVSFYGVWLMTEPDPSGIGEDPNITARKVVRVALVVGLLSEPVQALLETGVTQRTVAIVLGALMIAATLVGLVGEFAKFIYYERLARRIPDDMLAKRTRFLKWALTITLGVLGIIGGIVALATALGLGSAALPAVGALGCLLIPALIALIVFGIMTLVLLVRLRRAIVEQARVARSTWAAALYTAVPQAESPDV